MDALGEKLRSFFKKDDAKWSDKGTGRKLGNAEPGPAGAKPAAASVVTQRGAGPGHPAAASAAAAAAAAPRSQQHHQHAAAPGASSSSSSRPPPLDGADAARPPPPARGPVQQLAAAAGGPAGAAGLQVQEQRRQGGTTNVAPSAPSAPHTPTAVAAGLAAAGGGAGGGGGGGGLHASVHGSPGTPTGHTGGGSPGPRVADGAGAVAGAGAGGGGGGGGGGADYGLAPASAQEYELQRCLALILSAAPPPPQPPARPGTVASAASPPSAAADACGLLLRLLRNVIASPDEPKYRQVRLSAPRVQACLVGVPGAVEFLEAAGFQMEFAPDDGSEGANQGFLVLPAALPATALAEPCRLLAAAAAAHGINLQDGSSSSSSTAAPATAAPATAAPATAAAATAALTAAAPAPPSASGSAADVGGAGGSDVSSSSGVSGVGAAFGLAGTAAAPTAAAAAAAAAAVRGVVRGVVPAAERRTAVILPVAPDVEVPDWFFERTGVELKAQWQAARRRREEAAQLMTRAMRERQQQQQQQEDAGGTPSSATGTTATVRVRFPEGVCLQGQFGAAEPVSRVFEWVAGCLRPSGGAGGAGGAPPMFELITPDRKPLAITGPPAGAASSSGSGARGRAAQHPTASVPLTLRSAGLLPACLLLLRPVYLDGGGEEGAGRQGAGGLRRLPLLRDELLRGAGSSVQLQQ